MKTTVFFFFYRYQWFLRYKEEKDRASCQFGTFFAVNFEQPVLVLLKVLHRFDSRL